MTASALNYRRGGRILRWTKRFLLQTGDIPNSNSLNYQKSRIKIQYEQTEPKILKLMPDPAKRTLSDLPLDETAKFQLRLSATKPQPPQQNHIEQRLRCISPERTWRNDCVQWEQTRSFEFANSKSWTTLHRSKKASKPTNEISCWDLTVWSSDELTIHGYSWWNCTWEMNRHDIFKTLAGCIPICWKLFRTQKKEAPFEYSPDGLAGWKGSDEACSSKPSIIEFPSAAWIQDDSNLSAFVVKYQRTNQQTNPPWVTKLALRDTVDKNIRQNRPLFCSHHLQRPKVVEPYENELHARVLIRFYFQQNSYITFQLSITAHFILILTWKNSMNAIVINPQTNGKVSADVSSQAPAAWENGT